MKVLILVCLICAAWWVVSRWAWPWRPCPRCKGSGRNRGSDKRRHGDCKRCGGSHRVRRFGARAVHQAIAGVRHYRREKRP
jgi:hypothetical protein